MCSSWESVRLLIKNKKYSAVFTPPIHTNGDFADKMDFLKAQNTFCMDWNHKAFEKQRWAAYSISCRQCTRCLMNPTEQHAWNNVNPCSLSVWHGTILLSHRSSLTAFTCWCKKKSVFQKEIYVLWMKVNPCKTESQHVICDPPYKIKRNNWKAKPFHPCHLRFIKIKTANYVLALLLERQTDW